MAPHRLAYVVTFGDCDPAGIAFYPNFYAWFDRTFHDALRRFGGHAAICDQLGILGIGLMSAEAAFHRPARDGDVLVIALETAEWGRRRLVLDYSITLGEDVIATGHETRGLFRGGPDGIVMDEMQRLKDILDA